MIKNLTTAQSSYFLIFFLLISILNAQDKIPARQPHFMTGSEFMASIRKLNFENREEQIYQELKKGNIPNFLRQLVTISTEQMDKIGQPHTIIYQVMPDYLAIGCDTNFCRIPMGPITAQKIATSFGFTLPTAKLVDDIYHHAKINLAPIPYYPIGNKNETVSQFTRHNQAIEQQFNTAGGQLGELVAGIKKDVIIHKKLTDSSRAHHVIIYGWHDLSGIPIQPVYNGHINSYVDYSHGIRLVRNKIRVDDQTTTITQVLQDSLLFPLLTDDGLLKITTYPIQDYQ